MTRFESFPTPLVFSRNHALSSLFFGLLLGNWLSITTAGVQIILGSRSKCLHASATFVRSVKFDIFVFSDIYSLSLLKGRDSNKCKHVSD